ncbi:chromate transporter [Psychrobacillus sp. FSL K6-2684]|uniref:Chromate transporter n=2 Tax=Bacillaceae TaxID=186817 RepID=A0ABR8RCG4_9BACI|nr:MULTISPECIES: chromate transporter [Psychrobacillus]MBD7945484.1 chromate transporter [Psychrobacillus faecigallinarum]QEY21598.1 chromate transporter [Psychrobacillus sp. AK 1817]QGM32130.1 chromate transporter [Bacillus sp. N3536]
MVERQPLEKSSVRPKPVLQRDISWAFFRVGMLGFGGGPSSIPLVHQEVVKKYNWMDDEEFGDTLALANTMPGPIATKMAGYIGYRIAGFWGCVNALIASVIPTVILMILLLGFLQSFKDSPRVQNMTAAVIPVVAVMLALMTWDFIKKTGESFGWWQACLIIAVAALLMELIHIHPAIIIVVCMAIAFFPLLKRRGSK